MSNWQHVSKAGKLDELSPRRRHAMRTLLVLSLAVVMAPMATAAVWTTVYRCDGVTPLGVVDPNYPTVYQSIMVGTRLAIVVSSDAAGDWFGHLLVSWDDSVFGRLSGRDYNAATHNYEGSCLDAAGMDARARGIQDPSEGIGFRLNTYFIALPGEWFVFDYHAEQPGLCDVALYHRLLFDVPLEVLSFTHVPTRDFDGDTVVNFEDFALLARYWQTEAGPDPNGIDHACDLNTDGGIDPADLLLFREYWLERTDCNEPNRPLP